jgi:hypothetical protein
MITDITFPFALRGDIIEADRVRVIGTRRCIRPGTCRIRIFPEHDDEMQAPRVFVLATDLGDKNSGPIISVGVGEIASQVCLTYDIDPHALLFIEHYDDRWISHEDTEKFSLVHMDWNGARFVEACWQRLEKVEVEALIGEQLP